MQTDRIRDGKADGQRREDSQKDKNMVGRKTAKERERERQTD